MIVYFCVNTHTHLNGLSCITYDFAPVNEIAMYLYDIESQLLLPGDVSTIAAIHMAMYYQNDVLVAYFIEQFKQNHSEIIELVCA